MKFRHLVSFTQSRSTTGCPKSSFMYFISLYFSTIGLGKQIIEKKFVFQSNSSFSYLLCYIFIRIFDLCNSRQRCSCASVFSSHIFFAF